MPHFTLQVTSNGPLLNAFVGVSHARHTALNAAKQPTPQAVQIRALIDTGASCTCMDPSVVTALQLVATGPVTMNTPSTGATPHTAWEYDVSIIIPGASANHAPLLIPNIAVASTELLATLGFHALIGRDILSRCILTYNGETGLFMLAY